MKPTSRKDHLRSDDGHIYTHTPIPLIDSAHPVKMGGRYKEIAGQRILIDFLLRRLFVARQVLMKNKTFYMQSLMS